MKTLKKDIYNLRYVILIVIGYFIITNIIFKSSCIFKIIFGIDCPGCGLTRSCLALLRGDIKASIEYNRTGILWVITILLFIIDRYIVPLKIKPFPYIFVVTCVITLLNYILEILI